jgi:hypothetical protein
LIYAKKIALLDIFVNLKAERGRCNEVQSGNEVVCEEMRQEKKIAPR